MQAQLKKKSLRKRSKSFFLSVFFFFLIYVLNKPVISQLTYLGITIFIIFSRHLFRLHSRVGMHCGQCNVRKTYNIRCPIKRIRSMNGIFIQPRHSDKKWSQSSTKFKPKVSDFNPDLSSVICKQLQRKMFYLSLYTYFSSTVFMLHIGT